MRFLKYSILFLGLFMYACTSEENNSKPVVSAPTSVSVNEQVNLLPQDDEPVISFAENNTVYFDFDVFTPKKEDFIKIENQIKWLKNHKFTQIIIEGHTDIYGAREYNLALGEKRANYIKNMFIKANIDPKKIKIVSYGKERLADNNIQFKNRRAVTKILN